MTVEYLPIWMQVVFAVSSGLIAIAIALRMIPDGVRAIQKTDNEREHQIQRVVDQAVQSATIEIKSTIQTEMNSLKVENMQANMDNRERLIAIETRLSAVEKVGHRES